jgi:hypothetical protein
LHIVNDEEEVRVPNIEEQQKNDDALYEEGSVSDYTDDDVKEQCVAAQAACSEEANEFINVQKLGQSNDMNLGSRKISQLESR